MPRVGGQLDDWEGGKSGEEYSWGEDKAGGGEWGGVAPDQEVGEGSLIDPAFKSPPFDNSNQSGMIIE